MVHNHFQWRIDVSSLPQISKRHFDFLRLRREASDAILVQQLLFVGDDIVTL